ncbi:MAG: hypothetical protein P8Y97_19905 [Candidatus Lokiarchaeota archaeon]
MVENEVRYQESLISPIVLSEIQPEYIQDFLDPFIPYLPIDLTQEFRLPVKIRYKDTKKFNPILRLAKPKEGKDIAKIVKEDYEGTYPYKEMEDPRELKKMIKSGKYKFIVFLNDEREIIGSTCFVLDFKEKKGYVRTFVVKKEWLGYLDASKAYITASLMVMNKYRDKILIWWGEARTADAKSQYINRQCGIRPIAWLPNKDMFYNKIESDIMIVGYNRNIFKFHRINKVPKFIFPVLNCFSFADSQYQLGEYIIEEPLIDLDPQRIRDLKKNLRFEVERDKYMYTTIRFTFNNSDSYFQFLYTPKVANFEKTEYRVKNLEELYVFIKEFKRMAEKYEVRYMESRVSAYKPSHQKIFYMYGFTPRGYIPAFKLDSAKNYFEDCILFNCFRMDLVKGFEVIPEGKFLLELLAF